MNKMQYNNEHCQHISTYLYIYSRNKIYAGRRIEELNIRIGCIKNALDEVKYN